MMHRTIEALHRRRRRKAVRGLVECDRKPVGMSVELSLSSRSPNGVCLASFHRVRVYQWDHEAFPLTKGIIQILQ